jgi:hypothetical protein
MNTSSQDIQGTLYISLNAGQTVTFATSSAIQFAAGNANRYSLRLMQ